MGNRNSSMAHCLSGKRSRAFPCYSHETKTASWLPPVESWDSGGIGLPYGWEAAFDRDGKTYFINHVNRTTTCEDPRKDLDEEPPLPRDVELYRDPQKGFGFVAGSEKPVIVRFVTEGGPSEGKLLPGDQILQINGEDVVKSPRERVIELVRSCKHSVKLQVCQPITNNTTRKSALLTAAKKAKLKSNPSRVRFAEGVVINGSPLYCPSPFDSHVPFMPNVLKVFLENGQTKSFKYDSTTTVQDVLNVLQEKLSITSLEHFSLVVEHIKSVRRNKISILNPKDTLAKIAARPGAHNLRCLFRITFVPKDIYEFMQRDPVAFDYLFVQCCNDVVRERFAPELKYDVALRLAALHLQQHALTSGIQGKMAVKIIEREYGLEKFVPISLLETMKRKELLKLLAQLMKQNQALSGPGQKQLSALQAKCHYLKIVSDLPSYGAKYFPTCSKNSAMETAILIGPRIGISQISTIRNIAPINLAQFGELDSLEVTREDEFSYRIRIRLRHPEKECLNLNMEDKETEELVLVLERYYSQLVGCELPVEWEGRDPEPVETVPTFHSRHTVQEAPWSYCPLPGSQQMDPSSTTTTSFRSIDLSIPPPPYILCEERQLSRSNSRDQFSLATSPASVDHNMNEMQALVAAITALPNHCKGQPTLCSSSTNLAKDNNDEHDDSVDTQNFNRTVNEMLTDSENYSISEENGSETGRTLKDLADKTDTVAVQLQRQVDPSTGIDMHSVMSMELLEEETNEECNVLQCIEVKSNDVITRVTEMSKIINDAERYLSDDTKPESRNSNLIDLGSRCQDSLLFINRNEDVPESFDHLLTPNSDMIPSESEAESTPTNSPTHCPVSATESPKTLAKKMCSSFGLHSINLFSSMDQESEAIEELLRQLQTSTDLPFEESSLCLDPDIIDLTIIPPPNSEDVDFSQVTPDGIEFTSKSFLDLQSETTQHHSDDTVYSFEDSIHAGESGMQDSQQFHSSSVSINNPGILFSSSASYDSYLSLESTLPPSSSAGYDPYGNHSGDNTAEDDLAAYIIPPPPSSSRAVEEQNRVLARFRQAAEDIRRMIAHGNDTFAGSKYSDSMNSVSKFCTIPRRHEEIHRPPLSSLASLVTPIRETHSKTGLYSSYSPSSITNDLSSTDSVTPRTENTNSNHKMAVGDSDIIEDKNDVVDSDQRPQRPPRLKRLNSGPSDSVGTVEDGTSNHDQSEVCHNQLNQINGHVEAQYNSGNNKGPFSRTLSLDSFKGPAHRNREQTSQNIPNSAHLPVPTSAGNAMSRMLNHNHHETNYSKPKNFPLANGHQNGHVSAAENVPLTYKYNGISPKMTNGVNHRGVNGVGIMNGTCNGYDIELLDEPLHEDTVKECQACVGGKNGMVNGCACRKLDRFKSYHQSLPRKTINSRLHAFPIAITNGGTMENCYDDMTHGSRVFYDAPKEITEMVVNLDTACQARLKECVDSQQTISDPVKLANVRETLMTESRQFVTASKLFVKSITESSGKMEENLVTCLALLDRIFAVSELVVMEMTTPSQISSLVEKLKEMALAYSRTVSAAHCAASGEIPNPNMAGLMHQATSLATSLTTLMRTLRTFHTP